MTVQQNGLADNRRVRRKTPAPIMMTDDYDWMRARNLIIFFRHRSAEQGIDTQHGKKAAGNPLRASHFSLPIQRDIDARSVPKRADAGEQFLLHSRLLKEGVGKTFPRAARWDIAPFEGNQLFWIFDRQCFDQRGVNYAENRRVRADAQRQ